LFFGDSELSYIQRTNSRDTAAGQLVEETLSDAQEWIRINVSPGQYSAIVRAIIGGKTAEKRCAVNVNPAEHTKLEILLPIVVAAGQMKS
jgi:hypothetical protein